MHPSAFARHLCRLAVLQLMGWALAWAGPLEDGQALLKAGKPQEAEAAFTKALTEAPEGVSALLGRARARQDAGNTPGAETDLNRALQLFPESTAALRARGLFREIAQNNYAGAIEDYSHDLRLEPKANGVFLERGRARMKAGDLPGSLDDLDQALALKPDYVAAFVGRGTVLSKLDRDKEALESFQRALALEPNNAGAKKGLAALQAKKTGKGAKTAAPPGADAAKAASSNPKAVATTQAPDTAKPPSAPPASSANKATPSIPGQPSPAALAVEDSPEPEPGYYQLVDISMPKQSDPASVGSPLDRIYGEHGTTSSYTTRDRDHQWSATLKWSVPDKLIPGVPAKFRIAGSVTPDCQLNYGHILFKNSVMNLDRILVGVRILNYPPAAYPNLPPNVIADEFELVIPKEINQWKKASDLHYYNDKIISEVVYHFRSAEIDKIVALHGDGKSRQLPSEVKMEEVKVPLHSLAERATGPRNIVIHVIEESPEWPPSSVAIYTYRWAGPMDLNGDKYIEIKTEPAEKSELRADGNDGVILKARALPVGDDKPEDLLRKTRSITFSAEGLGKEWIDLSETKPVAEWMKIYVQATNPDPVRGSANKPPETLKIRTALKDGTTTYSKNISLKVAPDAVIDAKPDWLEFLGKSGEKAQVKVAIENAGAKPWTFRAEFARKNRPVAKVDLQPAEGTSTTLTLTEAGLDPEDASPTETAVLRIFAEQKDRAPLERDIRVLLAQEGLYVSATGRDPDGKHYRVAADGKGKATDVDFRVFLYDPAKKRLIANKEAVGQIKIECLEAENSPAGIALKTGGFKQVFAGTRAQNDATGIYRFSLAKELPGDGRTIRCDFKATLPGREGDTYTAIFTLGLVTTSDGPGSADWQLELDRCQEIIRKFVPASYYPQMQAMLEKRKHTLGAEGLHQLRERIWISAANLTLGEGGQGYADEAAWANRITETLEWTQWAGDMAFGAVIGTWTGPYGAFGATQLKSNIISAINAYQDGQAPQEWLWGSLATIPGIIEGKVIDVDTFEKLGVQNKAKAWAIYVSYNFLKNLYQGQTLIEALKNTAKEAGNNVLSSWLSAETKANGNRSVADWAADKTKQAAQAASSAANSARQMLTPSSPGAPAAEAAPAPKSAVAEAPVTEEPVAESPSATGKKKPAQNSEAAEQIGRRTTVCGEEGKPYAHPDDVLEIMRDPSKVRSLKEAPPEIQAAFSNTRESIYQQHDTAVVQHVKDTVPGMKYRMVKVMEFRTPGQTGPSLNTDRDYRVCYYAGRDPHTGKEQWVEVPRQRWQDKSYQTFAELTGGPTDSPEQSRKWAEEHQQLATDQYHKEASKAFTDQKTVWNEKTKKVENVQVVSNIERVTKQQIPGVNIEDPQSLGQMYQIKVSDAHHPHEAYVQANKAVGTLAEIRKVYGEQGRKIGNLPDKLQAGMDAVVRVNEQLKADPNRRDPAAIAEANRTLQANGFADVHDFMSKLGGQFESLKFAAVSPEKD